MFLLGPSHKYYLTRCALTTFASYRTPVGDAEVDAAVVDELSSTGLFDDIPRGKEESEHSLEMHVPYIVRVMQGHPFKLVPMLVGTLSDEEEVR